MQSEITREALLAFVDILEKYPQGLLTYERMVELMSAIGISCRLRCEVRHWQQSVTIIAPPSSLVPVEAAIETPFGTQRIDLEQRMSLPQSIQSALGELSSILREINHHRSTNEGQVDELKKRAQEIERMVVEESIRFTRSGSFTWPMDRFQLQIQWKDESEEVTVYGPQLARLAHASLPADTTPGIAVDELGEAVVKLILGHTIESGGFIGEGFKAKHKSTRAAQLLKEFLDSPDRDTV